MARTHIVEGSTSLAYGMAARQTWIAARGTEAKCRSLAKLLNAWIGSFGLNRATCRRITVERYKLLVDVFMTQTGNTVLDPAFSPQPDGVVYTVRRLSDTPDALVAALANIDGTIDMWTRKAQEMQERIAREFPLPPVAIDEDYAEESDEDRS